jgi:plastocyanin
VQSIGIPERVVALGAGVLLIASVVGAVRHLDSDPPAAPSADGTEVVIQDFRFGPGDLTVPVGDTVTWRNLDGFDHTVAGTQEVPTRSPDLGEGDRYEFTYTEAGTYEYLCTIHATMRGTVTVTSS